MSDTTTPDVDNSLGGTVAHAWEAHHAADWPEAYARWERVRELFPDYPPPYIHGGIALQEAGRLDEALAKLRRGAELFPDNPQMVTTLGGCLTRMGRLDEMIDYIRSLHQRQDYVALLQAAKLLDWVHPGRIESDAGVQHMVSNARLEFEMSRIDLAAGGQPEPSDDGADTAPIHAPAVELSDKELMLAFQSLGENCEFGLTQRHFGVEPIGLLRWAAISIYSLTQALNERFEGVGIKEHTKFVEGGNEYATAHRKYGMGSHTFVKVDKANEEAIFNKLLTRLAYLRGKLIDDLEQGDRTFVYTCEDGTTEHELAGLYEAVRGYGSRYLLFVRKSDAEHAPGTVADAGEGLMFGYIDRLGPDRLPHGDVWNISFHHWLPLLRAAHDMRRRHEAGLASSNDAALATVRQTEAASEAPGRAEAAPSKSRIRKLLSLLRA